MKVNYLSILREAFDGESMTHFQAYQSLVEIKSKLVSYPPILTHQSRDPQTSMEQEEGIRIPTPSKLQKTFNRDYNLISSRFFRSSTGRKNNRVNRQNCLSKQPQTIENTLNSLTEEEVFKIYSDTKFFTELLSNKGQFSRQIDQLLWRIASLIGQAIMIVQSSEPNTTSMTLQEISRTAFWLVELQLSRKNGVSQKELQKIKILLLSILQKSVCDEDQAKVVCQFVKKLKGIYETQMQTQCTLPLEQKPSKLDNKSIQTDGSSQPLKSEVKYQGYYDEPQSSFPKPFQIQVSQVATFTAEKKERLRRPTFNCEPNFKNYQKPLSKKGKAKSTFEPMDKDSKPQPKAPVWTPFTQNSSKNGNNLQKQKFLFDNFPCQGQDNAKLERCEFQSIKKWGDSIEDGYMRDQYLEFEDYPIQAKNNSFHQDQFHHKQSISLEKYQVPDPQQVPHTNTEVGIQPDANPKAKLQKPSNKTKGQLNSKLSSSKKLGAQKSRKKQQLNQDNAEKQSSHLIERVMHGSRNSKERVGQMEAQKRNLPLEIDLDQDQPHMNFRQQIVSSPASIQPIKVPVIAPSQQTPNFHSKGLPSKIEDKSSFSKKMREKWTPQQENLLVTTFIETGDEGKCVGILEAQYGEHPKWCQSGVKLRLDWIVRKVYEKFKSLNTKNESINKFKDNWEFISKKASLGVRTKLYRDIVTIYTAMLNMSQEKRDIISKKILQINRTCQTEIKL